MTAEIPTAPVRADRHGADGTRTMARCTVGAVAALMLFLTVAVVVAGHPGPFAIDTTVLDHFVRIRMTPLTAAAHIIALATDPAATAAVVVTAALWLLFRRKDKAAALFLVGTSAGTAIVLQGAKLLVARPRPPIAIQLTPESSLSFPSGHVTGVVAVFGALAAAAAFRGTRRKLLITCWTSLVVIVALDRLYLGVHWLSDVVGAVLLGSTILLIALAITHLISPQTYAPLRVRPQPDRPRNGS